MCLITLFKTVNCIHTQIIKEIERFEVHIKISLEQFGIFNNVDVYIYIFMEIQGIQHDLGLRSKAEKMFEKREKNTKNCSKMKPFSFIPFNFVDLWL